MWVYRAIIELFKTIMESLLGFRYYLHRRTIIDDDGDDVCNLLVGEEPPSLPPDDDDDDHEYVCNLLVGEEQPEPPPDDDDDEYVCNLFVGEEPPEPPPDDGREYFFFTVKYVHFTEPPRRPQTLRLFQRQRVVEREEFYSSAAAVISGMASDSPGPWKQLLEDLMEENGPWLISEAREAVTAADLPDFPGIRTARVVSLVMAIDGPYIPGGDDVVEEDYTGVEDGYKPAVPREVIDGLESVEIEGCDDDGVRVGVRVSGEEAVFVVDDRTCPICLDDFVVGSDDVIRMPCSHLFHKSCVVSWLECSNSCPYCRQALPL